ncbi:MAG: HAD-IA family hydrolase [Acidobacteria bacterium]|nr:HAD-IA family hydrolase [Acidobacteriota bacterium]
MIRALMFDLDDTLYLEKEFVISGYRAVARSLAENCGRPVTEIFSSMVTTLETRGREAVFQVLQEQLPDERLAIPELVAIYRSHQPSISLCPGYMDLLRRLKPEFRLGVITDGLPAVQRAKVEALNIKNIMDSIICTWEYGQEKQKPHPLAFELMLRAFSIPADSALYIGDNPDKDCVGAHRAGIRFVHLLHPHYAACRYREAPDFVISTLSQLPQLLRSIN